MNIFKGKIVLISGGTGSWGQELTKQLLEKNPKEIRIYSRGEFMQVTMERKFLNPKLKFIIGDVRDYEQLNNACRGVDIVFHLSALKHIPICELYPEEAIKTNIEGTKNLIKASINNRVKKVIDVSTDKACMPINFYGMTKAIGERLSILADSYSKHTKFSVIRGGNVLGTSGSVIPHFINQICYLNKVEVTDPEMTRYYLTLPEAISLLFATSQSSISGGIFVMKMPSFKIIDIAKILIELKGDKDTKLEIIGVRKGEKIHECLVSSYEAPHTYIYEKDYYLIHDKEQKLPKVDFKEYTSNTKLSGREEILELLAKGNFIRRGLPLKQK